MTTPVQGDVRLRSLFSLSAPLVGRRDAIPQGLSDRLSGVASWIALPMHHNDPEGWVLVLASSGAALAESIEVAAALAAQGVTAIDKAELFGQVQALAISDELTGISNRRCFFDLGDREVAAALRQQRSLAALMVDIDHFKRINDAYGHGTGDDVIRIVAQRIRATDLLGRYGGEEFAILLPDAGPNDELPERLRTGVADPPIQTRTGPVTVTISLGLTYLSPDDPDLTTLLARADQALYTAKEQGRNQVCVNPPETIAEPRD